MKRLTITDYMRRAELSRESSFFNWYFLLMKENARVRMPRTFCLPLRKDEINALYGLLDGEPVPEVLVSKIHKYADRIGYPLFMRSDQGSGKHEWDDTCYVPSAETLIRHLAGIISWHSCVDLGFEGLVFRKYIPLKAEFKAFLGMPVARERRYFIRNGVVICHHPYWVEAAVHAYGPYKLPEDWKTKLAELNRETPEEIEELTAMTMEFGRCVDGYWSVDFALGADGYWYLIDAARGEVSWHPEDCEFYRDYFAPPPTLKDEVEGSAGLLEKTDYEKVEKIKIKFEQAGGGKE